MDNYYKIYFSNRLVTFLLIFLFLTANSLQLNATIRYVSKTGNSTPPYLTWETSADSIQKCINICVFGDTIYVANGVYAEQVVMIPGLSLIGAGMDSCVIYLSATGIPAVQIKDTCLLRGFKILLPNTLNTWGIQADQNGEGSIVTLNKIVNASLGLYLSDVNTRVYCNIFENIKTIGIWLFNSNSVTRQNIIHTDPNSPAGSISAIIIEAFNNNYKPTIDSNYIVANTAAEGIRQEIGSRAVIRNNKILMRSISTAIFLGATDTAIVYNNRIYAESVAEGIYNNVIPYLQVYNNYLTGNIGDGIRFGSPYNEGKNNVISGANNGIIAGGDFIFQYNNLWNNNINYTGFTPDSTNLSVDPMIANDDTTQGELDFHLQKYSPLIDAGDPTILDKDGTRSDIGLYGGPYGESYVYVDLPPRPPVNLTANVDSLIKLNWNKNTEVDFSFYNIYRDTTFDFTIDSTKLIASVTDTFYYHTFPSNIETLYYKLTAVDNQGNESNPSEQVAVILVSVKNEWVPVNNYFLYQNYPNPFNPSTKIGYKLKERGYVKLYVYDIKGELVSVLVNQTQEAGYYEVEFNAGGRSQESGVRSQLASGVYIYQIMVSNDNRVPVFSDIKKMIYVK
jgi:hypothetical protein